MPHCFKTVEKSARAEHEVRHSRFIARCSRVGSAHEAMAFVASVTEPKANHTCFAWRVGDAHRFSDDGEPGGSAGRPILTAIEAADLDYVAVAVTRYFGGIKLGVGGLVRAYRTAAAACLEAAGTLLVQPPVTVDIDLPLAASGPAMTLIYHLGGTQQNPVVTGDRYRARLSIPRDVLDECVAHLAEKTRGQAIITVADDPPR